MEVAVVVVGLLIEVEMVVGTGFPVEEEVAGMVHFQITRVIGFLVVLMGGVIGSPVVLTVEEAVAAETGEERDGN